MSCAEDSLGFTHTLALAEQRRVTSKYVWVSCKLGCLQDVCMRVGFLTPCTATHCRCSSP